MNYRWKARGHRSRALRRAAATLLMVAGLLLVAEGVVTLAWQEPISALSASKEQNRLNASLSRLEAAALASPTGYVARGDRDAAVTVASDFRAHAKRGQPLGRIEIPRLGKRFVFVSGVSSGELKKGPGHYPTTALPGEHGTVGIAGHRTTYLAPFRNIDRLRPGDAIRVRMPYGEFAYRVEGRIVVSPKNTRSLRRVGHDRLALTSCHPPTSDAQRMVVTARLTSEKLVSGASRTRPRR